MLFCFLSVCLSPAPPVFIILSLQVLSALQLLLDSLWFWISLSKSFNSHFFHLLFFQRSVTVVCCRLSNFIYNIKTIGHHMLSGDKYGYLLPFEAVSILLLACIVGGLLIARKR